VSVCQGDVRNSPVEALELRFPLRVERRGLRPDSGGPGRRRGGLGMVTEITNLVEGTWRLSMAGRNLCPPWGLWDGENGQPGTHQLRRPGGEFEPVNGRVTAPAGAVARILTGGGGGWGAAAQRPVGEVAHDVQQGYISPAGAAEHYAVVIDEPSGQVDVAASKRLRAGPGASQSDSTADSRKGAA
jgi:N-methylhydantoinase B